MNLLEALEAAVEDRGEDYVYPFKEPGWTLGDNGEECRYTLGDGTPACIIGLAAAKMGLDPTTFEEGSSAGDVLGHVLQANERGAADMAQNMQDIGRAWGQVLEAYKEAMKNA